MSIRAAFLGALFLSFTLSIATAEEKLGRETGLPVPRFISLNSSEANMRRGPGQEYPIEWVYHQVGYPVRVIGESGHWRKVEDPEGAKGWFHYALLSGKRTVLVLAEKVSLTETAAENSQLVAILQKGVVARLHECSPNWCRVEVENLDGWLPKTAIWGVDPDEIYAD